MEEKKEGGVSERSLCVKGLLVTAQGFTLVELLIALFVFTLLSMFAYRAIGELSKSSQLIDEHVRSLASLQRGLSLWEKDFNQMFLIDSQLPNNEALTAVEGRQTISLLGAAASFGETSIQTIKYSFEEGVLYRERDVAYENVDKIMILDDISRGEILMIESEGSLVGVRLLLEHPFFGRIDRLGYAEIFAHSKIGTADVDESFRGISAPPNSTNGDS